MRERSYDTGGGGLSGMTYRKLRIAFDANGDVECKAIEPLADFVTLISDGKCDHPELRPFLATQRGIPLKKKDGGVRPVGILEVFARIASGVITRTHRRFFESMLHPHDFGSGASGGIEAAAHATQITLRQNVKHIVIKADVMNAFNEMCRQAVLDNVRSNPDLVHTHGYINTVYGGASAVVYSDRLNLKDVVIANEQGVIQGDPMASWLYDITYSRELSPLRLEAARVGCVILTIHDDTYIVGPAEEAFTIYDGLTATLPRLSLVANASKGQVFSFTYNEQLQQLADSRGLPVVRDGIVVGGAPVGTAAFQQQVVDTTTTAVLADLTLAEKAFFSHNLEFGMPKLQGLVRMIQMCFPSQLNHLMRCLPPELTRACAAKLDAQLYSSLMRMLGHGSNTALMDPSTREATEARRRLFLPYCMGGYGITCSEDVADAAYVGSWTLTGSLVERVVNLTDPDADQPPADPQLLVSLQAALDRLRALELENVALPLAAADAVTAHVAKLQGVIYSAIARKKLAQLQADLVDDRQALARLTGAGAQSSWCWLTCPPAFKIKQMGDFAFKHASAMRLRLPICLPDGKPVPATCAACGAAQDYYGDHAFRCSLGCNSAWSRRHTYIKRVLVRQLLGDGVVKNHFRIDVEEPLDNGHFVRKPAAIARRVADYLIFDNFDGRKRVGDLTIVHPAPDRPGQESEADVCGAAAKRAEETKYKAYTSDYQINMKDVLPLAFETLGGLGPAGRDFIKEVADIARPCARAADGHLVDYDALRSMYIRDLRERIAVTLQKANSEILLQWGERCCGPPTTIAARAAAAGAEFGTDNPAPAPAVQHVPHGRSGSNTGMAGRKRGRDFDCSSVYSLLASMRYPSSDSRQVATQDATTPAESQDLDDGPRAVTRTSQAAVISAESQEGGSNVIMSQAAVTESQERGPRSATSDQDATASAGSQVPEREPGAAVPLHGETTTPMAQGSTRDAGVL